MGRSRIEKLLVKEGNRVKAGQIVGIIDSYETRLGELNQAMEQVKVAQARLAKVKAGAPPGEIAAQKAELSRIDAVLRGEIAAQKETIARLEAQLNGEKNAQQETITRLEAELRYFETEYQRYGELYREGAIETAKYDSKLLERETALAATQRS